MKTSPSPSRRSAQWPLRDRLVRAEAMPPGSARRAAPRRGRSPRSPSRPSSAPRPRAARRPRIGPTVQATCSTVERSEVACSRSSSPTRFGSPAQTAGRKKPVAIPLTAASATIAPARRRTASATNVPARTRSETTISRRRERRSTSGPSVSPITHDRQEVCDQERGEPAARARCGRRCRRERERGEIRPDRDPAVAQKSSANSRFRRRRVRRPVAPSGHAPTLAPVEQTGNSARNGTCPVHDADARLTPQTRVDGLGARCAAVRTAASRRARCDVRRPAPGRRARRARARRRHLRGRSPAVSVMPSTSAIPERQRAHRLDASGRVGLGQDPAELAVAGSREVVARPQARASRSTARSASGRREDALPRPAADAELCASTTVRFVSVFVARRTACARCASNSRRSSSPVSASRAESSVSRRSRRWLADTSRTVTR